MLKPINTDNAPIALGPYSQAMEFNGIIFVSGQIPIDPKTNTVVEKSIKTQTEQVCINIGNILNIAGSSYENVIKTTCYLEDMSYFKDFNAVYEKYFVSKPARACVAVKQLPKNVMCEIEVIAKLD